MQCVADIVPEWRGDCVVDHRDLGIMLASYLAERGESRFHPIADVHPPDAADGVIDQGDLGALLAEYLQRCD